MSSAQSFEEIGEGSAGEGGQYLTFILADEEYAVDILRVQEIKGWDSTVTALPNTPEYIKGVINLRGTIVPVVDLRQRLALSSVEYGATTVVIVLSVEGAKGGRVMGVVVDAVSEVYDIGEEEIKPSPDFGDGVHLEYIRGIAKVHDKMILVLEIDRLLNDDAVTPMPSRLRENALPISKAL